MKIRPLHKTPAGHWLSDDGEWLFYKLPRRDEGWNVHQKIGTQFWSDTPYFYFQYPTLTTAIKGLEKARRSIIRKKNND